MSTITTKQIFKYMDEEDKGTINKNDIPQALRYLGIIKKKQDLDFLIKDLEEEVSFDKFSSIVDEQSKTSLTKEQIIDSFDVFDKNKNGKCSAKELFHCLKVVGEKLTEDDINYIQTKINIDKNGFIDYKNFVETLMK